MRLHWPFVKPTTTQPTGLRPPVTFLCVGLPPATPDVPPLAGRVRVDGRFWVDDRGTYRPCYMSGFKLPALALQDFPKMTRYLDLAVELGFNGVRVLAGALSWGPQTADEARRGLPLVLEEAQKRQLSIEVTGLSDSGVEGWTYDIDGHLSTIGSLCRDYPNTVGEVANEPYHGTQASEVHDYANLARWGQDYFQARGISAWAEGAPETDEPDPANQAFHGSYITLHLDRSRDPWNMVRRVRELEAASANYRKPVMNNEPIGWAEASEPGRRSADPSIAFTMGALSRGFEVGLVSHADHGLECDDPGPVQRTCHQAAREGFHIYGTQTRLVYKNTGWADSPVKSANFGDETHPGTIVRAYSFMDAGNHGWTVMLGLTGDPQIVWQNGFVPVKNVKAMPGVEVWEVAQGGAYASATTHVNHLIRFRQRLLRRALLR